MINLPGQDSMHEQAPSYLKPGLRWREEDFRALEAFMQRTGWDNFPLMLKEWIFAHPAPASFLMALGLFGIGGFILMLCGI